MATITNATLTIDNSNATNTTVTVRYRLTPSQIEKLAGTVFSENIRIIGDDSGAATDITISTFPDNPYAVNSTTNVVDRVRTRTILKSNLNEDPEFLATGAETIDEIFARISITYAASAPVPPALPGPVSTTVVSGAWK